MTPEPSQQDRAVRFGAGAEVPYGQADNEMLFRGATAAIRERISSAMAAWIDAHDFEGIHDATATDFLRDLVLATEPMNVYSAGRIAVAAAGLLGWAHLSEGWPLQRSLLLNPQVMEMYLGRLLHERLSAGTVRNYRGYLQRVSEAVGATVAHPVMSISGKPVPAPYSPDEEQRFAVWARTIPSDLGIARGMALLGLVAGAGLRNEELPLIQVRDVIDAAGMWIRVHGPGDRLTPVRPQWVPYVRRRLQRLERDDFVFPHGGPVNHKGIHDWIIGPDPSRRPVPNRLRSTWIVAQLGANVPPESLLAWSGIERGETIANYLQFLPDSSEELRRTYMHLEPRRQVRAS